MYAFDKIQYKSANLCVWFSIIILNASKDIRLFYDQNVYTKYYVKTRLYTNEKTK